MLGMREARDRLGRLVDEAFFQGKVAVITRKGEPRAVLISHARYEELQAELERRREAS